MIRGKTNERCRRTLGCSGPFIHAGACNNDLTFHCECPKPQPRLLTLWGSHECTVCRRYVPVP